MDAREMKIRLNSIYGKCAIYADTDSVKYDKVELMKEIINECIKVQCECSDISLQDRVYITFGRIVTAGDYGINDIENIINMIKSEFNFLEECWNGEEKRES